MQRSGDIVAGRYSLEHPLGEGGMGSVWRARHLELGCPVAVKFPHARRAALPSGTARFRREARAAAKLRNAHVVRILDLGIEHGTSYLVMELLEGESLKARLERDRTWSLAQAVELARQAAIALDSVHAAKIVHRDLKPSNLFVATEGDGEIVKLLDFGVAKWFDDADLAPDGSTESGLAVGSVQYMSPEQARGECVDPRSDVWALGVVVYQVLTGVTPFEGANVPDTVRRICAGEFSRLSDRFGAEFRGIDQVFERTFELDRGRRIQDAGTFSSLLAAAAQRVTVDACASGRDQGSALAFGRHDSTLSALAPMTKRALTRRRKVLAAAVLVSLPASLIAGFGWLGPSAPSHGSVHDSGARAPLPSPPRAPAPSVATEVTSYVSPPPSSTVQPEPVQRRSSSGLRPPSPAAPRQLVVERTSASRTDAVFGLEVPR